MAASCKAWRPFFSVKNGKYPVINMNQKLMDCVRSFNGVLFRTFLVGMLMAGGAASADSTYTRETFLPTLSSVYYSAATSNSLYLGVNFINPSAVMMSGTSLPPELLQDMSSGQVIRIKVMIPPGTEYVNFTVDTGQAGGVKWGIFSQDLPYCGSQASNNLQTCISSQDLGGQSLITGTIYPLAGQTGTNATARYNYVILQAGSGGFRWANVTVNTNINNTGLYNTWRSARSWAGGSGDADGLGTGGSPPINSTTFAVSPSAQQIAAAGTYTLTAQNGTIQSCASSNSAVVPNPTVVAGGGSATGSVIAGAAANSQATITCLSSTGSIATATITVSVPTSSTSGLSLTGLSIGKLTSTSAVFSATLSAAATGYWVAFPYATTVPSAPTGTQIKAGQDSTGAAATLKGSGAVSAGVAKEFPLSALTAGTAYQAYFYGEDATGNKTAVIPVGFSTNANATVPTKAAITAVPSGTNDKLNLSTTITPASDATGVVAHYVAALVPASIIKPAGGLFFLTKAGVWTQWTGGALLPYLDPVSNNAITILNGTMDVTFLIGTEIYAGYGIRDDLVSKKIYTIVK